MKNTKYIDRLVLLLYTLASLLFAIAAAIRLSTVPNITILANDIVIFTSSSTKFLNIGNIIRVPAAGINILASFLNVFIEYWILHHLPSPPPLLSESPTKHILDFPASFIQFLGSVCFGFGSSFILAAQHGTIIGFITAGSIFWLLGSICTFLSTGLLLYVEIFRTFHIYTSFQSIFNSSLIISILFFIGSILFITGSSLYLGQGIQSLLPAELCLIIGSCCYLCGISIDIYYGIQILLNTIRNI